jgi:hypothetical protein
VSAPHGWSGLWKDLGRPPQKLTGVGFISEGFDPAQDRSQFVVQGGVDCATVRAGRSANIATIFVTADAGRKLLEKYVAQQLPALRHSRGLQPFFTSESPSPPHASQAMTMA